MRIFSTLILGAALIGSSAVAATQDNSRYEAKLSAALTGRVAGKPVSCINLHNVRQSTIYNRTAIVYEIGNTLYVNRPTMGKESLDDDDILLTKSYSSDLCSVDTVDLIDRGSHFRSGFVGLGEFVPYSRVRKD